MAKGAKISAGRQAKQKHSSSAAWTRMLKRRDKNVAKSSRGKFKDVEAAVAHQVVATAANAKLKKPRPVVKEVKYTGAVDGLSDFLDHKKPKEAVIPKTNQATVAA